MRCSVVVRGAACQVLCHRAGVHRDLPRLPVALDLLDQRGRLDFLARPGAKVWQVLRPLHARVLPVDEQGVTRGNTQFATTLAAAAALPPAHCRQ